MAGSNAMRSALLIGLLALAVLLAGPELFRVAFAKTLDDALASIRPRALPRLQARGVEGSFAELCLVGVKDQKRLLVLGRRADSDAFQSLATYSVAAASGVAGPKLREGDRQVPEGVYSAAALNPNSRFHLSIDVGYPNAFDRARAVEDGRDDPGSDIFIHGGDRSVGCLAIGDRAIEEVFLLTARTGPENVTVLLCPSDPTRPFVRRDAVDLPDWIGQVDAALDAELRRVGLR